MTNDRPNIQIALGSVYKPPEDPYPRLLIMRRWPRGIAKGAVDQWEPALGPTNPLLDAWNAHEIPWDVFASRYRAEVTERINLIDWVVRMATTTGVTLLCGSHPDEECHRSLLATLVHQRVAGTL